MKKNISRTLRKRLPILLKKHNAFEISRMYGVSKELVRQLIVEAGGYRPEYRKWRNDGTVSEDIRDRLRQDYLNSDRKRGTPAKLSRKYGLSYYTVVCILGLKKPSIKKTAGTWGRVSSVPAEIRAKVESEYLASDQRFGTLTKLSRKYGLKYSTIRYLINSLIKRMKLKNKTGAGENGDM